MGVNGACLALSAQSTLGVSGHLSYARMSTSGGVRKDAHVKRAVNNGLLLTLLMSDRPWPEELVEHCSKGALARRLLV